MAASEFTGNVFDDTQYFGQEFSPASHFIFVGTRFTPGHARRLRDSLQLRSHLMSDTKSHVLIVDDSLTQRVLIQSLLENAGFRVTAACDGREALAAVRGERPELIVTDLEMPEMDGLDLVRAIKHEFSDLPVVLATAMGSETIAAEALRLCTASYVPKSSLSDLVPTIQRLLALTGAELAN